MQREIHGLAAAFAVQVVVLAGFAQVHDPGAMAEMHMMEESRAFQSFQGPIDGREVDSWVGTLNSLQEVGRCQVLGLGTRQHPADSAPGCSEPEPIASQHGFQILSPHRLRSYRK